jgi:hypothetical protein
MSPVAVRRADRLPSWWCWWLGTLVPSAECASAIGAATAPFSTDSRRQADGVVSPAGKGQPSWLRRGAPGLGARKRVAATAATATAALRCSVIPVQAGIQLLPPSLDARFRGHDEKVAISAVSATVVHRCCEGGAS